MKPLIYGISWYLDAATNRKWDGIIVGDYEAVLPLPYNRKLLIKQIYTPQATQKLGPFCNEISIITKLEEELRNQLKKFLQVGLSTNYQFNFGEEVQQKLNLVLPLNQTYKKLYKDFRKNRKYDSRRDYLIMFEDNDYKKFIGFFRKTSKELIKKYAINVNQWQKVIKNSIRHQKGKIYWVKSKEQLLSAVFITIYEGRLTLLSSTTSEAGYKIGANAFLITELIQNYSNSKLVFDFEGSEIPGVKDFYESFGAQAEYYYFYTKQNKWVRKVKAILGK